MQESVYAEFGVCGALHLRASKPQSGLEQCQEAQLAKLYRMEGKVPCWIRLGTIHPLIGYCELICSP